MHSVHIVSLFFVHIETLKVERPRQTFAVPLVVFVLAYITFDDEQGKWFR
jgi:hypothetical protein